MNHRGVLSGQFVVLGPMIWQLFEMFLPHHWEMRKIELNSLSEPLRWAQLMAQALVSPPKDARSRPSLTSLCQAAPEITQQRCGQTQAERERQREREGEG